MPKKNPSNLRLVANVRKSRKLRALIMLKKGHRGPFSIRRAVKAAKNFYGNKKN